MDVELQESRVCVTCAAKKAAAHLSKHVSKLQKEIDMPQQSNRGFAAMDPERQREIASEGGRAAHASGNAHEWNSEEAAEAGRRGGQASHHQNAAFHHNMAGYHHGQAARHHGEGNREQWELHSRAAESHGEQASEHAGRARRGFAAMDPERQREIAAEGGRASHASGHAHEWDSQEASEAGRRGGQASHGGRSRGRDEDEGESENGSSGGSRRGFAAMDPERQREIAAEGGRASHGGRGRDEESEENEGSSRSRGRSSSTRGGTSEQHAEAGRQSHKYS